MYRKRCALDSIKEKSQNYSLLAAKPDNFLHPSLKLVLDRLPLEITRTATNGVCQQSVSIINNI